MHRQKTLLCEVRVCKVNEFHDERRRTRNIRAPPTNAVTEIHEIHCNKKQRNFTQAVTYSTPS